MGRLVRISDATGPSYFGTSPISEEERARRLAEREQAVQQNPAGTELSGGLELPRPGTVQSRGLSKAYQPEQALANGTRERAWEERGARTLEPQPVNRVKSGVQSIVTTGAGAIPLIWDTAVQLNKNTEDRLERLEENGALDRLVQVNRQIRGLEGNETGEALDYIRSQERWRELDAERKLLEQQVHDAYVQTPVSPEAPGMQLMRQAGEYREEALKGLEGVPRFLGETVLSIGQNAALLPTAAINPAIPLAAMGTISAADKMYELNARGFSPSESLTRGVVSGGIEAATEKIPLENLLSVVKTGGNSALRNLLRQAGIEAGEESVSYLANYIADLAAQDPEAEFSLQELARSAAGGGISGGVFGGAAMGVNALTRPRVDQTMLPTEPGQTVTLPSGEAQMQTTEAGPGLRPGQVMLPSEPGQVTVLPDGIDNPSGGGYDGAIQESRTGGTSDARGEEGPAARQGAVGADVRGEAGRTETMDSRIPGQSSSENGGIRQGEIKTAGEGIVYERGQASDLGPGRGRTVRLQTEEAGILRGRDGTVPEAAGGVYQGKSGTTGQAKIGEWAKGHIVESPSSPLSSGVELGQQKAASTGETAIQDYQRREHHGQILDTVRANLDRVSVMRPVAQITGQEFQRSGSDSRSLRQRVIAFFNSIGNKVTRPDLGDIELNTSGVRDSLAHGYGRLKAATFSALPMVLENGELIAHNGPYEGHNYDSYIISAPVEVNGDTVYVGALVIKDTKQRYKLHEVLTASESGVPLFQSESTSQGAGVPLRNDTPLREPEGSPTGAIIPTEVQEVNPVSSGQIYERAGDGAAISAPVEGDIPNPGAGPQYLTGPESSVGGARAEFDPWSHFQNTRSEFIPEGANAARPVDVPTTDPQGRLVRRTASTAMGAKAIPDEVVSDIQNMVLRGDLSYTRKGDKSAIDRAVKTIQDKGYQGALENFRNNIGRGVISKDIAALGQQLLINAANAGDENTIAEVLSLYGQMETTAGQVVQAASILRKLSPNSQLYAATQAVSDLERTIQKKYKDIKLTIDPTLLEEFAQQTDQAGRDMVLDKIYQNVADQVPPTWRDKWNAWRYLAMLANPRTHVRNVAGNVFFQPLRIVKDRVAAAIESGVSAASGGKLERTKSFLASPALYRAAWADWSNVRDALSGNKYDDVKSEINSRRRIFRFAPLEAARTTNSWLLEFEDSIFKRITYADALAGYLQANGVTAEQLRSNIVDSQLLSRARDYAGQEALRATYQDRNMVSDKVVEVARALGPAGEALLPFKRTPANILVRGLEYSPAGLTKALTADLIQVKQGKMSGAEAIDHIAAGLTGSALFALGALLFSQGIVTSGGGDDENQDKLNELVGMQNYALNLPDGTNVTLDWLAPEALPFFMGVELMDSMGQNGNTADSIMTALKSISDPMLELSMLQSLNDVIDSVSFSENKLGALAASSVISYFTQAIPTLGGQVERSAEDVRMSTYTDKNLWLPTDIQYALGKASARIPGWDYQQIPYIDAWGREEGSGPLVLRMGNNFLNPAYTSRTEITPVDEEVRRLYNQTGDGGVVPDRPPRYITVNGERVDLTAAQYTQYATERGQTQFSMLEELFDQPEYNAFSITDKTAAVSDVYEYADQVAKSGISDYELDGWVAKAANSGLNPVDYILFRNLISGISGDTKREQILAVINDMNVPDADKDQYYLAAGYKESTLDDTPWN